MASPSALPTESDIKELQALISGKKKESYLLPLLEKLFHCLVDTDKWLFLSELVGHDSKKISRYAYYFLSSRHGVPQSPLSPMSLTKLKELASVDMRSAIPHRVVYALRLLESCTRIDEKDSLLMKSLPELMDNLFGGQGENFSANDKDKKKKTSKSGAPSSSTLVAAECLVAYRTRFTFVEESLLKYFTKGLNHKEQIIARHASALLLRAVHAPNANLTHLSKILLPHVGLDNVVVPSNKPGEESNTSHPSKSASVESTMVLYGINRHEVSVRVNWVRISARLAREDATNVEQKEKWLSELCDFLVDESDRVAFSAMEGIISSGWVTMSKANVTNPVSKVTIPVLQALKTRLIPSLASASTPVVHYAARIAKQLAQCYMKFFEAGSVGNTVSPRRSTSLHSLTNSAPVIIAPSGGGGPGVQLAVPGATQAGGTSAAALHRKGTVAGRGRTWTKTDTVPFDEEHPLKDVKGALHIVFRNHRSSFVRSQVLSALIWLEYSWNGFEVEDLLLKERYAAQPALLHDDVFNDFLERVLLSPQLVDTLLRVFFEHFTYSPGKLNIAILMKAWNSIMQLGETYKTKVLNSIFLFLDHPVKKETRNIIYSVHKVIYWQLGEQGTNLANEICGELPISSAIVNDEPHFPISNLATRAIVSRLEYAVNSSPWELRVICTEALAKFAFKASYPVRLRAYSFFKLIAKVEGASLYPVAAPFIQLLDRIFALRRAWSSTYQSGAKLSLASVAQLTSEIDDLKADLSPYVVMGNLNPIGADLIKFLSMSTQMTNSSSSSGLASNKASLRSSKLDLPTSTPKEQKEREVREPKDFSSSKDAAKDSTKEKGKDKEREKDKDKEREKDKDKEKRKASKSDAPASSSAVTALKEDSSKTRRGRSGSVSKSEAPSINSEAKDKEKKSKKKD